MGDRPVVTRGRRRRRLTESQRASIEALRRLGREHREQEPSSPSEEMTRAPAGAQASGEEAPPPRPLVGIKAGLPVTVSDNVRELLVELKDKKAATTIRFSRGLEDGGDIVCDTEGGRPLDVGRVNATTKAAPAKGEVDGFGLAMRRRGKKITCEYKRPKTPASMRAVSSQNQGDLRYRIEGMKD